MNGSEEKPARSEDSGARLYTITPAAPFLDTLARAVLSGDLPRPGGAPPDALDLPEWTILLPTRRAVRAMQEAFLRASEGQALLLPRIRPIGDVDEDAALLAPPPEPGGDPGLALDLPPAISNLERRLVLTRLILAWSEAMRGRGMADEGASGGISPAATPAQAASLAARLAELMDSVDTERADLSRLAELVPERYAEHWRRTLEFLEIVTKHWPRHLEEQGLMAPYARRDALMAAETERLETAPPGAPVIAAGSTGTVPATAALLGAVARLENGAVVLPGLDLDLDDKSWEAIGGHAEHPQFGMKQLLDRIGAARGDVHVLGPAKRDARARFVSEAMRPAGTTRKWRDFAAGADRSALEQALRGVARINAPTSEDEAEVAALILRHTAETPGRTAALVTPDRTLARRVAGRLAKWNLDVDDSAGRPLDKTVPGVFMDLVAEAAQTGFAPVPLLALLKHPLARLGREAGETRRAARLLELIAMRQPAIGKGFDALEQALERTRARRDANALRSPALQRLKRDDWRAAETLLADLKRAFAPLVGLFAGSGEAAPIATLVRAHVETGEALAAGSDEPGWGLWSGEAGEALSGLFAELMTASPEALAVAPADYPELYRAFAAGAVVRPRVAAHPRLFIWGPLEARLQRPDVVVLGGLNEDVWPAAVETDPWLSRPMRETVGLPAPERRTGLAAHDVAQLLGAEEVYLTRAEKVGGAPAVPSRWLLRLDAFLEAVGLKDMLYHGQSWLAWARSRDDVAPAPPMPAPVPKPPQAARPKRLSVTRVETWIANPYAIFAGDILGLRKLEDIAGEPDAALKGQLVHDALDRFAAAHPERLPNDVAAALRRFLNDVIREYGDHARIEAFWRAQFTRFARWFAATEPRRRAQVTRVFSEVRGELAVPDMDFTLSARADRIDELKDGTLAIYDYKTGQPPTTRQVEDARAPQLALEAAIAAAGGFTDVPQSPVSRLAYIRAQGHGRDGEEREVSSNKTPGELAGTALSELQRLISAYTNEEQGYAALRRRGFDYRHDDYAHLARVQELLAGDNSGSGAS